MNAEHPPTLLMIDDHPLFRRGVLQLIRESGEFEVVAEASSGPEGIELARRFGPDMILLDLNMRDMNGLEVLKLIKAWDTDTRVVMLTVSDEAADLVAALRAGADGYLLKEMDPDDLVAKLKMVAAGEIILTERLTRLLAHSMREDNKPRHPDEAGLTEQERRILELIAQGMNNKLIGRELNISDGTVKVHVKHLLRKLNLHSKLEAAVLVAEKKGLLKK